MIRASAIVIGLFLVAVWIAGLAMHTQGWLTWLDVVGALCAFAIAAAPARVQGEPGRSGWSAALSVGLFVLWILGLGARAQTWIVWCTFAAACATAIIAFGARAGVRRVEAPRR